MFFFRPKSYLKFYLAVVMMVTFCDDETKKMHGFRFIYLFCDINDDTKHHNMEFSAWMTKNKKMDIPS